MNENDERWMAYIDAEVSAVCNKNGWGHQIRRKWSAREKPVRHSTMDDYEWKLIAQGQVDTREAEPRDFDEGVYFVLRFDRDGQKFILQHDTFHGGIPANNWFTCTYTEIHLVQAAFRDMVEVRDTPEVFVEQLEADGLLPDGWLREFLFDLTGKFQPNYFSIT